MKPIKKSAAKLLAASKCDFSFKVDEKGLTPLEFTGTVGEFAYDWNSFAPNATVKVQSSKCDWNISAFPNSFATLNASSTQNSFNVGTSMPFFIGNVGSAKCDFNISAVNMGTLVSKVNTNTIGTNMIVASSKCDWNINSIGGDPTLTQRPKLDANLASSKCDFVFNIELGLTGGQFIKLRATSSAKCDFKIDTISNSSNTAKKK
jgi:hypothetical protein